MEFIQEKGTKLENKSSNKKKKRVMLPILHKPEKSDQQLQLEHINISNLLFNGLQQTNERNNGYSSTNLELDFNYPRNY